MADGDGAKDCFLPMEDTHFVLDISSDEESHFLEEPKFSGSDDDEWLLKLLQEGGMMEPEAPAIEDSDEVVLVKEVMAKSKISDKMDADDDDCVILDGDPDKVVAVDDASADGDSDDLHIVGEKGQVACRDYPHPRHLCVKFSFRSSSHANYCTLCHCYVCDLPAPCSNWGTGTFITDHCHATDQEEIWKTKRKMLKQKKSEPEAAPAPPPMANPTILTRPAIQLPPWQPPPVTSFTAPVPYPRDNYQPVPYPRDNNMTTSILQSRTRIINHCNSRSYYAPNAPVFKKTATLSRSLTVPVPTNRVTTPQNVLRSMSGSNLITNQNLVHRPNLHQLHQSSIPSYGRSPSCIQPPNLHFQGMNLHQGLNQQPLVGNNYRSNQIDPRVVIGGNNNNGFTVSDPQIRSNDGLEDRFVGITVADIENWLFED